jgi:hypothetical protein
MGENDAGMRCDPARSPTDQRYLHIWEPSVTILEGTGWSYRVGLQAQFFSNDLAKHVAAMNAHRYRKRL